MNLLSCCHWYLTALFVFLARLTGGTVGMRQQQCCPAPISTPLASPRSGSNQPPPFAVILFSSLRKRKAVQETKKKNNMGEKKTQGHLFRCAERPASQERFKMPSTAMQFSDPLPCVLCSASKPRVSRLAGPCLMVWRDPGVCQRIALSVE